jgi:hypothetical protein
MARLRTDLVDREIRRIIRTSQMVKGLLRDTLERIENNPGEFPPLDDAPDWIASIPYLVCLRKAKIVHRKHDFRLIFGTGYLRTALSWRTF